jgi:SagB-type dehydrogenase family enzyme
MRLLDGLTGWTGLEWFRHALGVGHRDAARWLDDFAARGLLERSEAHRAPQADPPWDDWGEAAAFLHYSTRNREFLRQSTVFRQLAERARQASPPPPLKSYVGVPRQPLPRVRERSGFHAVLRARRTWRRFGRKAVPLTDLSAVLHATFAVQRWVDLGALGRVMLRSSPSGGARHPIEAYVLARRVSGLTGGTFYYAPDEHALVPLGGRVASSEIVRMLAGQTWFGEAAAVVVLTAVLARKAWIYRNARAYRSLLLEAGHFCQTFCLAATARNLAPFCTGAFSESLIERTLGLDDGEPVLYVAGLGSKPAKGQWSPLPRGERGLDE